MPKNTKTLMSLVIDLLREGDGQVELTRKSAATKLDCNEHHAGQILKGLADRKILTMRRLKAISTIGSTRNQKGYKLAPEFYIGDSWKQHMKGFYSKDQARPLKSTISSVDPANLSVPTPDAKDLDRIARLTQAYEIVKTGSARLRKLWDNSPKNDIFAAEEHLKLIKKTQTEYNQAQIILDQLQSEVLEILSVKENYERFLELTMHLYVQSLETEKLRTENEELTEERDRLLKDSSQLMNDVASLEIRNRITEPKRNIAFDGRGTQVTGAKV